MRVYTAHRRGGRLALVPEGGSLGALLFGPLWLALHGAWLAALASAIVELALGRAAALHPGGPWPVALLAGVTAAIGMFGQDLRRLELAAGGYAPFGLVAGRFVDDARLRLADRERPSPGIGKT